MNFDNFKFMFFFLRRERRQFKFEMSFRNFLAKFKGKLLYSMAVSVYLFRFSRTIWIFVLIIIQI